MALLVRDKEHALLRPGAFDFIILDDELLLQHLDRVELLRRFRLCQHDLTEVTLAKHGQEVEVSETDTSTSAWSVSRWRCLAVFWTGCRDQRRCLRR